MDKLKYIYAGIILYFGQDYYLYILIASFIYINNLWSTVEQIEQFNKDLLRRKK